MRGLARVRGALSVLLVAAIATLGVGSLSAAHSASAAENSGDTRELVAGGGAAFLVHREKGTVQAMDPATLQPRGRSHDLGTAMTRPVVDPEGTLWAGLQRTGEVVPFRGDREGEPIKVAEPGNRLFLNLVSGRLAVVDPVGKAVVLVGLTGIIGEPIEFPGVPLDQVDRVLVPAWSEGSLVPILAASTNDLYSVDVDQRVVHPMRLPAAMRVAGDQLGEPQALAGTVYVPNYFTRQIWPMDAASGKPVDAFGDAVLTEVNAKGAVVKRQYQPRPELRSIGGQTGRFSMVVRNGVLWWDAFHAADRLPSAG